MFDVASYYKIIESNKSKTVQVASWLLTLWIIDFERKGKNIKKYDKVRLLRPNLYMIFS